MVWLANVVSELEAKLQFSVPMEVPPLERFTHADEHPAELGPKWDKWKRSLQYYIDGKGIKEDGRKRALLLHCAGPQVQEVFSTLPDTGEDFASAIRALDSYFQPLVNKFYERYRFRQLQQSSGEAIDQFISRLRHQAIKCAFSDEDQNIIDQMIEKCQNSRVRCKLLEEGNELTLSKALTIARTVEAVALQEQDMGGHTAQAVLKSTPGTEVGTAFRIDRKQTKKQTQGMSGQSAEWQAKKCSRCGWTGHMPSDPACPARNVTCNKCNLKGHYARQCRTKSKGQSNTKINFTEGSQADDSENEYMFAVDQKNATTKLLVGGVRVEVVVDSGAGSNVISEEKWQQMKKRGVSASACFTQKKLYAYGASKPLEITHSFKAMVNSGEHQALAEFVVVKGRGPILLGRETSIQLNLLQLAHVCEVKQSKLTELQTRFKECFTGLGKLKGFKLQLHVDPSVRPVAQGPRRIPFGLRDKVDKELQNLLDTDVIEQATGPTPWASPVVVVVPKPSGEVRLCVDMRRVNAAIVRERHPIPTVDEVIQELSHSTHFSKIDLKKGYHQIELAEESRGITTFVTHKGLFRYKRLVFGISSAPEAYQHIMQQVLSGCDGVVNISDDIVVHGKTQEEHDNRLEQAMERLKQRGLTVNPDKCEFDMDKMTFMGHVISKEGISPSHDKVSAIKNAREPKTASEVRSFLGLVNFCARFLPDLATAGEPLRRCIRSQETFVWGRDQAQAFSNLKKMMSNAKTLAIFYKNAKTTIVADASPVGLGAVLLQDQGGESKVISYASRSLSDVERRYSQTEKEALALVWACERFSLYVVGQQFRLITDHKPLEVIYGDRSKPSARIERWVLRLQPFDFKVEYKPGKYNIADPLSRLSAQRSVTTEDDEYVKLVVTQAAPVAITPREIERTSYADPEIQQLRKAILHTDCHAIPSEYRHIWSELTTIGHVVLRGCRIVIPNQLRPRVLQLAHEGHQGIVKCKERLRSKVWWPGIDPAIERVCRECHGCQITQLPTRPPPMKRAELPTGPWVSIGADLLGPMPDGEYVFVAVDYYSRFFEVDILRRVRAQDIICSLERMFARYGAPDHIITDNGPQFVDSSFNEFLTTYGIEHTTSPPMWPRANGEVERQNRSLLKAMRIAHSEGKDWKRELNSFLLAYRTTPHTSTGVSPGEVFLNRKVKCKLPLACADEFLDGEMRDQDLKAKEKGKLYGDERARTENIMIGDKVLLQHRKENKLSTTYEDTPYDVLDRTGAELLVTNGERVLRRHVAHTRPYLQAETSPTERSDRESPPVAESSEEGASTMHQESTILQSQRPVRERKPPAYLEDYVTK